MRKEGYYWVFRESSAYFHNWEKALWKDGCWTFFGETVSYIDSDLLYIGEFDGPT